jgi:hypothetical protein
MSVSGGPDIVENGLVLCLDAGNPKSYPGSGTTWTDISRNSNNGTLTNGPTFNSLNGGNITFDGSDDHIVIPTNTVIDNALAGQFTFEIWLMPLNAGARYGKFFGKGNYYNRINGIGGDFNQAGPNYDISFQYRDASSNAAGVFTGFVSYNNWFHIVVTRNSANLMSGYNNGVFYASVSDSVNLGGSSYPIILSRNDTPGEPRGSRIASFRFYTKGLSQSEILQNYNATKGRFRL